MVIRLKTLTTSAPRRLLPGSMDRHSLVKTSTTVSARKRNPSVTGFSAATTSAWLCSRRRLWRSMPLPVRDPARHNPEQRMDPRRGRRLAFEPLRCSRFELLSQMTPLEVNLALRQLDLFRCAARRDSGRVEPVSPLDRFGMHGLEILCDEGYRRGLFSEPGQLGMMPVSFRRLFQNRLGEQALPPQRDEPARIEMLRMNAPQTHTERHCQTLQGRLQ